MNEWFLITLFGDDRPGIVAAVTKALFDGGCNLGEASMIRLGGNFSIMMMVRHAGDATALERLLQPVVETLSLRLHVDAFAGELHRHKEPDVRITVFGADRAGIVAQVTGALAEAGLNIVDLETDVGGTEDKPIYIMQMEGEATQGIEALRQALAPITAEGIEADIAPIDTVIG